MWAFSRPTSNRSCASMMVRELLPGLSDAEHMRGQGRPRPSAQNEPPLLFVDDLRRRVDPLPRQPGSCGDGVA